MRNGTVIYSSPFVPEELVAAHGLLPSRVTPRASEVSPGIPTAGMCPCARGLVQSASEPGADAVIIATTCDQMRRAAELIAHTPVFLMNVPHTWQTEVSFDIYLSELRRLGRFLVKLGGTAPDAETLRETALRCQSERAAKSRVIENGPGIPVAVVGCPVMDDGYTVFDLIRQAGGRTVLDGTETGERCLPGQFGEDLGDDPLRAIAAAYFRAIPDPFRRPNTPFFEWLKRMVADSGARGLVLWRYVWCDIWHAEAARIAECAGVPFLQLDVCDGDGDRHRNLSRLQSFMEGLA